MSIDAVTQTEQNHRSTKTDVSVWSLAGEDWVQLSSSNFVPSNGRHLLKHSLKTELIRACWHCIPCHAVHPDAFNFCPNCGLAQPTQKLTVDWFPPNGSGAINQNLKLDLTNIDAVANPFPRPALGDFVYGYGTAGLAQSALIAFDKSGGGVWIKNPRCISDAQDLWVSMTSYNKLLSPLVSGAHQITAHINIDTWVLPTQEGLQCLSLVPDTEQYRLSVTSDETKLVGLGSAALLGQLSAMPVLHGESLTVQTFAAGQFNVMESVTSGITRLPVYGAPLVDLARRTIYWLCVDHYLVLNDNNGLKLSMHEWMVGVQAHTEFGSPYIDQQQGQFWQLCYNQALRSFGYHKLTTSKPSALDWKPLDSPVLSIGRFSSKGNAYTHRDPWIEEAYEAQDSQDFGMKFALTQIKRADERGSAIYLQVPYDGAIVEFFQNSEKYYACTLKVTADARVFHQLPAIREPWKTQIFVTTEGLHVAHPDLTDIYLFKIQGSD